MNHQWENIYFFKSILEYFDKLPLFSFGNISETRGEMMSIRGGRFLQQKVQFPKEG
jgi:hypothetical protein